MDADPKSTSQMDFTEGEITVKGEEEYIDRIFFDKEEKVVEKEIKRRLTPTPEEFAESKRLPEGPKTPGGRRHRIRKVLLDKQGRRYDGLYMCPGCRQRRKLRLYRVNKDNNPPRESDYVLLCSDCVTKKREQGKKTKLWSRGTGIKGGTPESKQTAFLNSIRALVFERDGKKCPYCGGKENLGLAALMPLSRGGKLCFDNYTVSCQKCRGKRSGSKYSKPMTPLEYFWQEEGLKSYLSECLDDQPVVSSAGVTVRVSVYVIAEIQRYLHKQAAGEEVERSTAERLAIELSKTDEDRRRERQQLPW